MMVVESRGVLSRDPHLGKDLLPHPLHQNVLRDLIGVMNLTSVTPENSCRIKCVILHSPMV